MAGKRIRFGIQTPLVIDWQPTLVFWRFVDRETPIDSAWTFDHFVPPMPGQDPLGPCLEGWTALAALALGCRMDYEMEPRPQAHASAESLTATIDWYTPTRTGDQETLAEWRAPVGPPGVDGIVGIEVLRRFDLALDYRGGFLLLSPRTTAQI